MPVMTAGKKDEVWHLPNRDRIQSLCGESDIEWEVVGSNNNIRFTDTCLKCCRLICSNEYHNEISAVDKYHRGRSPLEDWKEND